MQFEITAKYRVDVDSFAEARRIAEAVEAATNEIAPDRPEDEDGAIYDLTFEGLDAEAQRQMAEDSDFD